LPATTKRAWSTTATAPFACCAFLALSGFSQLSLPLGVSLLGARGSDRSLVRLAERIAG